MKRLASIIIFFSCLFCLITPSIGHADSNYLKETSKAFISVGKKAIPAVVFIKSQYVSSNTGHTPSESENPFDYFNDEFFRRFFGGPPGMKQQPQVSGGSGFIVSPDGYILTNHHVIKDANQITVILNNGDEFDAQIVGSDPRTDLAVIKIDTKDLPFIEFGNSKELEIGEWVVAIGSPFALQASLTVGVVSAKGRQNLRITDLEDFIQTDAAINPGNSGGPLLNLDSRVIGINTAIVSQNGGYMGIGFAIPSNMAKNVMDQIITNGIVKRGHLGITLQLMNKEMAEAFNLDKTEGVLITEVTKDSAAEQAGLKQGDIILSYNDIPIKNISSFRNEIALMPPGLDLTLTIFRDNKKQNVKVTLGQSPDEHLKANKSIELGIEVANVKDIPPDVVQKWQYTQNVEGVMITSVKYGSIAEKAGLQPGMLIMQINHKKIKNAEDFAEAMKDIDKRRHILFLVRHQNVTRFITIKLK